MKKRIICMFLMILYSIWTFLFPCNIITAFSDDIITNKKVSVIIPVYNMENCLEQCMESIINQTLTDIEIICIDDCSTDKSLDILTKYFLKDNRIKLIKQQENQGAYVARNKGLEIANGEYIGFVDPDDYIELNTYEKAYSAAKINNADIVAFGGETFGQKNNFARRILTTEDKIYVNDQFNALLHANGAYPYIWNKIYKRSLILDKNIKFEKERNGCDNIFCFYIFPVASRIVFISDKLYHYRIGRPGNAGQEVWNNKIKNIEVSIKTNKYIINKWLEKGYAQRVPMEFFERYVNLYFQKIMSLKLSLKIHFSKRVINEIFTDDFTSIVNNKKLSDNIVKKLNVLKQYASMEEKL